MRRPVRLRVAPEYVRDESGDPLAQALHRAWMMGFAWGFSLMLLAGSSVLWAIGKGALPW